MPGNRALDSRLLTLLLTQALTQADSQTRSGRDSQANRHSQRESTRCKPEVYGTPYDKTKDAEFGGGLEWVPCDRKSNLTSFAKTLHMLGKR